LLTSPPPQGNRDAREAGYTLVELLIVMAVMAIVLAIAGSALVSMQNTTSRNTAMINVEQDASTTLALVARDVRSAHSIGFASSTTNAADSVILYENQPNSSATIPVEWVYQPPAGSAPTGTLSREVLDSALNPISTQVLLRDLNNTSANPVFSYYDLLGGDPMLTTTSTADATLANCTTAIGVDLSISPSPVPGVSNFEESNLVAITDQEQLLSAPGNGQC
jgi:prepilin-type N-terminal cleavage/methylation domain-containing protein